MERRRKFVWVSTFLHGWYDTNFKTYELLISIDLSWSSQISWTKILQVFKILIIFSGYMIRMELRRLIRQINYQILLNQIKSKFDYWRELRYKFILWRDLKKISTQIFVGKQQFLSPNIEWEIKQSESIFAHAPDKQLSL